MIYNIRRGFRQLSQKQATALNNVSALHDAISLCDIGLFKQIASMGYMDETLFVTDGEQTLKVEITIQRWKESE